MERNGSTVNLLACTLAGTLMAAMTPVAHAFQGEGTVIICSIEPLSGVGTAIGAPNYIGKQIAIDEINDLGGIEIDGKKVQAYFRGRSDQARAGGSALSEVRGERRCAGDHWEPIQPCDGEHVGLAAEEAA